MPMTIEEKANQIVEDIRQEKGTNPVHIFKNMAKKDYISIHGPEHHILDGACILTAFYNAGGEISLDESLHKIAREGLRMPGAMCGLWGVCGAVASVGAALAVIDGTGPLSDDGSWGEHMKFTSEAINEHYSVALEYEEQKCEFSDQNRQCIKEKCPFYGIHTPERG